MNEPAMRERVADMLADNDAAGSGPVSREEYLADADALLNLVGLRELITERDEAQETLQGLLNAVNGVLEGTERTHVLVPVEALRVLGNAALGPPEFGAIRKVGRAALMAASGEHVVWPS